MQRMLPLRWFQNIFKIFFDEIRLFAIAVIVLWPNTPIGSKIRKVYWSRKTGAAQIVVGRNSVLHDCGMIDLGANIDIGENVEIIADIGRIHIGSNVLMARGVYIRSSNHQFSSSDVLIMDQGHYTKSIQYKGVEYGVVIESDIWIGANVIILSGAMIGEGAVIGAGSVVTGTIPPFSVAVGSPARVVAKRGLHKGK